MADFDQVRYKNEFAKEKYDRITLVVKKGEKDRIKSAADRLGKSVNAYVTELIERDLALADQE